MELLLALYTVHVLLWLRPSAVDVDRYRGTEALMPTTLNTIDL